MVITQSLKDTFEEILTDDKSWNTTSNIDLQSFARNLDIKSFQGVFSSDNIPKFKFNKNISYICNLQESHQSGSHWVALYYDNKTKKYYYFDSYGINPPDAILDNIRMNKNKVIYSTNLIQRLPTSCGLLCIIFLTLMEHTHSRSSYYDIILDMTRY
jgi:hypothetical protein